MLTPGRYSIAITLSCAALMAACAQPRAGAPAAGPSGPSEATVNKPTRVTLASASDLSSLATKFDTSGTGSNDLLLMTNSPLVVLASEGTPQPRLASDIPSRDRGTWTVNPDGTMATTWTIRPNAIWHDEQPVTSRDFAFALDLYLDEEIAVANRNPERFIERIDIVDDKTFTIRWKVLYPAANRLLAGDLEPLPEHVLGALYRAGDKRAFQAASFWTTPDYVGNGPFRLVRLEPGVESVYRGFPGFFLGRPKLDEVVFRVITDPNAVVVNLLSGGIDGVTNNTFTLEGSQIVRQEWERTSVGQVLGLLATTRLARMQQNPAYADPPGLRDLRVRRALLYGIDRRSIAEQTSAGLSSVPDAILSPADRLFPRADAVATKYPFDQSRALALLQDAGWTKRGNSLVDARDQRFALDIRTTRVAGNETVMALMANDLSGLGMEVSQNLLPPATQRDPEFRATFSGLTITAVPVYWPEDLRQFTTNECPTTANRFTGRNDGCWSNNEFDQWAAFAMTTVDQEEGARALIEGLRVLTDGAATIPFAYNVEVIALPKKLIGHLPRPVAQKGHTYDIHEWSWS